jgi:N utilization substance protein B
VDILYQADLMERSAADVVAQWRSLGRSVPNYAQELVEGVEARRAQIDRLLGEHAEGWTVQRMAVVDRTILRVACQELCAGLPTAVVVNEAVELANELSTEDSGRFVNGVLGRIAEDLKWVAPD